MIDQKGRTIDKLRVSVIDTCQLACKYCVSSIKDHQRSHNSIKFEETLALIDLLHKAVAIKKVRFTGGEPLLYSKIAPLISQTVALGIDDIGLTTNGQTLAKYANILKDAGLKNINVSIDAINPLQFNLLTRGGKLQKTLDGIDMALNAGLNVKLNTVVMGGQNDNQIVPILKYAISKNIEVRYLELMQMGPFHESAQFSSNFYPMNKMLIQIKKQMGKIKPLTTSCDSTSLKFGVEGGSFGVIANTSAPFCANCSRLRLTNCGELVGCLSNSSAESLMPLLALEHPLEETKQAVLRATAKKRDFNFKGSHTKMSAIGG